MISLLYFRTFVSYKSIPLHVISNLTKTYGTQTAVNNISFNVNKGEIVGFLGPNGAGKSTTMKMITGFINADKGAISVSGIDVLKSNIRTEALVF